jgi:hypothetical protein
MYSDCVEAVLEGGSLSVDKVECGHVAVSQCLLASGVRVEEGAASEAALRSRCEAESRLGAVSIDVTAQRGEAVRTEGP